MFDKNLLTRSITASILFVLVISLILAPVQYFLAGVAVLVAIACWEWANLAGCRSIISRIAYSIVLFIGCFIIYAIAFITLFVPHIMLAAILGWLFALVAIVSYPKLVSWKIFTYVPRKIGLYIVGVWFIAPCVLGVIILQSSNVQLLFFPLTIIWAMDIGAYLVGKKYGKHKIIPKVSPGKSYQGLAGGIVCAAITIGVFAYILPDLFTNWWLAAACGVLIAILSVIGDLFESLIKRTSQVKESGSLLAGHGGLLDRIDGLTIAVPLFLLSFFVLLQ
jgi:phosphatidate cytidylyltransferase